MAGFLEAFVLLLGIIDPVASLAAFYSLTAGMSEDKKRGIAHKAVLVAAIVFFLFAIGGKAILDLLDVDLEAFRIAGGIILIILGIQMGLGISFPKKKEDTSEVAVVIGTPMISGPATISAAIILSSDAGTVITALAGAVVLIITLMILAAAGRIEKAVGRGGLQLLSTMMGIITMAWGIQFLLTGLRAYWG